MQSPIITFMNVIAMCGILFGANISPGSGVVAILTTVLAAVVVILLPTVGCLFLLMRWGMQTSVRVSGLLLFCILGLTWALVANVALPVSMCDKAASAALYSGVFFGAYCFLINSLVASWRSSYSIQNCPKSRTLNQRNAMLLVIFLLLIWVDWSVPSIKWGNKDSVAIAVTACSDEKVRVDLYGYGVSQKVVKLATDRRLRPGTVERVNYFGWTHSRGWISYNESPDQHQGTIRQLTFHHTNASDDIVPLLANLSQLQQLDVRETRISPAGVRRLCETLPKCKVLAPKRPLRARADPAT